MARPRLPIGQHGNINFRKTATGWHADTRIRKDDGKLHRIEANRKSREGARIALEQACREAQHETSQAFTPSTTVTQLAEAWFKAHEEEVRPTTRLRYYFTVYKHIIPDIGANSITEVKPILLQKYIIAVGDAHGYSVALNMRTVLNQIFDVAVRDGALIMNPARQLGRMKLITHKRGSDAIPPDKITTFINAVNHSKLNRVDRRIVFLMISTGLRLGEVLALTWDKIDFQNHTITVSATMIRGPHDRPEIERSTKTQSSNRTIKVSDSTMQILRDQHNEGLADATPLVFPNIRGAEKSVVVFDNTFKNSGLGNAIPGLRITPHSFRKTCTTWLHYKGMDWKDISDYLGHANSEVTQQVYTKANVNSGKAAQALDGILSR